MNHLYLSRTDIETIAQDIAAQYKSAQIPQKHLCYSVDPEALAGVLGLTVDYQILSRDGTILGATSPSETYISILDSNKVEMLYYLDGRTVLVEKRLTQNPRLIGRRNFTIAHEIAHQILYREYPDSYGIDCRTLCDYRRSSKTHSKITDWHEWQADTLGAAILLPEDAVKDAMFYFGLGERMTVLNKKYSPNRYESFCQMADFLGASKATLSFRMEQLGLLERNQLTYI